MSRFWIRTSALVAHAIANFLVITLCFRYDITGSWLSFFSFVVLSGVLLFLFIRHLLSYIYFLKK